MAEGGQSSVWWVYLLRCGDGSIYCGIAIDTEARLAQHRAGKGARYTRGRGPIDPCGRARCGAQGDALRIERAIKALPRPDKLRLAESPAALAGFVRRTRSAMERRRCPSPIPPP